MNTLKNTVSMMEMLPENSDSPFQPLSEKEILNDLQISRIQTSTGQCKDMYEALVGIREKYGI